MDTNTKEMNSIEKRLDSILKPISPEKNYITNLERRLLNESRISIDKPDYLYPILFASSFFFIGLIIVWILNHLLNRKTD
jgi:hypothetical protein